MKPVLYITALDADHLDSLGRLGFLLNYQIQYPFSLQSSPDIIDSAINILLAPSSAEVDADAYSEWIEHETLLCERYGITYSIILLKHIQKDIDKRILDNALTIFVLSEEIGETKSSFPCALLVDDLEKIHLINKRMEKMHLFLTESPNDLKSFINALNTIKDHIDKFTSLSLFLDALFFDNQESVITYDEEAEKFVISPLHDYLQSSEKKIKILEAFKGPKSLLVDSFIRFMLKAKYAENPEDLLDARLGLSVIELYSFFDL